MTPESDRAFGAFLGLAVGDALGTTLEFRNRDSCPELTDMVGGGPFSLRAGEWTDDTSMALALADSLIAKGRLDLMDLADRFVSWWRIARDQSRITHGATQALDACEWFASRLRMAILGATKDELLAADDGAHGHPDFVAVRKGGWKTKTRNRIKSSGYVIHTLEAAFWAVEKTGSFEEALLLAVNLGDDADTVGAVTGQLAGALYGRSGIPDRWLAKLAWRDRMERMAGALLALQR